MKTLPERGEAADLVAVLVAGEKVPREIQSPLIKRELIEREEASKEEEEAGECVVVVAEGAEGDLDPAEVVVEAASGGSENLKGEAEVIDRKSSIMLIPFNCKTHWLVPNFRLLSLKLTVSHTLKLNS